MAYEDRMAAANPLWLASAEEEFGEALDLAVARGELTMAQGDQLFDMFIYESESAAQAAMQQMIQANIRGAAALGGGVPGARALMAPPGVAVAAPLIPGMPALAPAAAPGRGPRGKVATLVVRQDPTGQVELLSTTPGRPALYQRDVTAAKRLKRVGKKIARLFPKRRSRKKVFKAAGSAIA